MDVGENNNGELGDGTTTARTSPVSVLGSGTSYKFIDFQLGGESGVVAIDTEGQVWGWGQWGHVGDHTTTDRSVPTMVSLPKITPEAFRSSPTRIGYEDTGPFFTDIAAGNQHNVALKEDGSAWAWGSNTVGQLGDGTIVTKGAPTSVAGSHSFIDIAAGIDFSYALKEDESIFAWGDNTCGKLGDNTTTDKSSPVSIPYFDCTFEWRSFFLNNPGSQVEGCSQAPGFGNDTWLGVANPPTYYGACYSTSLCSVNPCFWEGWTPSAIAPQGFQSGFRPSSCKITHTGGGALSIIMYDTNANQIANVSINSNQIFALNWFGYDLDYMTLSGPWSISNIQFFDCYAN